MLRATVEDRADHTLVGHLGAPLRRQLRKQRRTPLEGGAPPRGAAAEEHGVDDAVRGAPVPRHHLVQEGEGFVHTRGLEEQAHEDREGDVGRRDAILQHVLEHLAPLLQAAGLCTTVDQAVVHDLVAPQAPRLQLPSTHQGLLDLARLGVAFDQRAEGDQIRLEPQRDHILQKNGSGLHVLATDADIYQGVEQHQVARHTLVAHLLVQGHRTHQVMGFREAFDQRRVQDGVLVQALQLHLMKDAHRLVQVAALDASVEHAAARDVVHAKAAWAHLLPDLEHGVDVPRLAICLHDRAVGDRRPSDPVLVHQVQCLLQLEHVADLPEHVEQCVEDDFVDVVSLLLDELVDQGDAPAHRAPVVGRHQARREERHEVLVRPAPLHQHKLEHIPCLAESLGTHCDVDDVIKDRVAGKRRPGAAHRPEQVGRMGVIPLTD
mmetsp:Transcript_105595/g.305525  ORF Transcript_105595/g.305525 Transcript_105595/m.305525 type:complete len:434 (+) Transcript_105595:841-2142(+)